MNGVLTYRRDLLSNSILQKPYGSTVKYELQRHRRHRSIPFFICQANNIDSLSKMTAGKIYSSQKLDNPHHLVTYNTSQKS